MLQPKITNILSSPRLNHAVKRHKPNEDQKPNPSRHRHNLYDNLHHLTPTAVTSNTLHSNHANAQSNDVADMLDGEHLIKNETNAIGDNLMSEDDLLQDIKKEPVDGEEAKPIENYYTDKGLQPSLNDLDQLFDYENSGGSPSLGVSTPFFYRF